MDEPMTPDDHLSASLLQHRMIVLSGEITENLITRVSDQMMTLQLRSAKEPINLVISSAGGDTYAAFQLCDLMTTIMTAPVHGIALGMCGSAATFIMLSCAERLSTPNARFLIHSGVIGGIEIPTKEITSETLEGLLNESRKGDEAVINMYMNRLTPIAWAAQEPTQNERRSFVLDLINRGDHRFDQLMSADEALEAGLIQKIVRGKLDIFETA